MSELAKLLTANKVRRIPMDFPITEVLNVEEGYSHASFRYSVEYRVEAHFGALAVAMQDEPDELQHAIRHAKKKIVWAVFEEFSKPLSDLYELIARQKTMEALAALRALETQMFSLEDQKWTDADS